MKKLCALALLAAPLLAFATVVSTTTSITYTCDDVTTVFAVPFRFMANADLAVSLVDVATSIETPWTISTNYTLTGAGSTAGGNLTTIGTACAYGNNVKIERTTPITQGSSLRSQGKFSPSTHETMFDRLTLIDQELARRIDTNNTSTSATSAVNSQGNMASGTCLNLYTAGAVFGGRICGLAAGSMQLYGTTGLGNPLATFSGATQTMQLYAGAGADALQLHTANARLHLSPAGSLDYIYSAGGTTISTGGPIQPNAANANAGSLTALYSGSVTYNFAPLGSHICATTTASVPGVTTAAHLRCITSCAMAADGTEAPCESCWVSATDTVTIKACNYTAGTADPSSLTFYVTLIGSTP